MRLGIYSVSILLLTALRLLTTFSVKLSFLINVHQNEGFECGLCLSFLD